MMAADGCRSDEASKGVYVTKLSLAVELGVGGVVLCKLMLGQDDGKCPLSLSRVPARGADRKPINSAPCICAYLYSHASNLLFYALSTPIPLAHTLVHIALCLQVFLLTLADFMRSPSLLVH
jgi:hypothetical protein